jgi:hypothetical protein
VRCLIDLSAVQVFESVGIYTILLIIQRRRNTAIEKRTATVAIVTESVGAALQMCLDEASASNDYFSVFQVEQEYFDQPEWHIITPDYARTRRRLSFFPKLSQFMDVVQGFVTGQDKIFLRPKQMVPRGEEGVYIEYLSDRKIGRYSIPKKSDEVVFFPYRDHAFIGEDELMERFPKTWEYLESNKSTLSARKSAIESNVWWRPTRSRPQTILRPKIVCPHLMLTPRFSVNLAGNFAISRSPFVIVKDEDLGEENTLLRFFCAVLNSTVCNWYLRANAPKYGKGYNRLEVSSLNHLPVPDLLKIDTRRVIAISEKVEEITRSYNSTLDDEIDREVSELYGLSASDRSELFGL